MTDFEIQAFLAVVEKKNISKAADAIAITQSALSRRIDILEDELGYKLFDRQRGSRNIALTEEGRAFIPVAKSWMDLWREAQSIGKKTKSVELRIACIDSLATSLLSDVLADFMKQNPDVMLTVSTHTEEKCYYNIQENLSDIAFVSGIRNSKSVNVFPAFTEPFVFICGKDSDYPEEIDTPDLDIHNNVYYWHGNEVDSWYRKWFHSENNYAIKLNKISLLKPFMFCANKWALIPSMNLEKTLKFDCEKRKLNDLPADRCIYYVTNSSDKSNSKLISKFLACFKKHLEKEESIRNFIIL